MLQHFIAAHCMQEDQQELVTLIRALCKPRVMAVQAFWYRLRQLNSYIGWLPGTAPSLPDEEICEMLYEAMSKAWRNCFISSGQSKTIAITEMVCYFRAQKHASNQCALENQTSQKKAMARISVKGSPVAKAGDKPAANKRKVNNDNECPIHGGHKWKDCMANTYGNNPKGDKRSHSSQSSTNNN